MGCPQEEDLQAAYRAMAGIRQGRPDPHVVVFLDVDGVLHVPWIPLAACTPLESSGFGENVLVKTMELLEWLEYVGICWEWFHFTVAAVLCLQGQGLRTGPFQRGQHAVFAAHCTWET